MINFFSLKKGVSVDIRRCERDIKFYLHIFVNMNFLMDCAFVAPVYTCDAKIASLAQAEG